jgi:hypothetical protein
MEGEFQTKESLINPSRLWHLEMAVTRDDFMKFGHVT